MLQEFQNVEIEAIAACVPRKKISNDSFGGLFSPKEYRVFEKTVGILERRWAEKEITASDLGYEAALDLINKYNVDKEDIECLIFLSQTPDYKIPFTSNILQHKLGLKNGILCLDINAGCAGFIQGLSTAFSIAKSIKKGKILFIVAETLSKILSIEDRSTAMLFGDGAAAVLISSNELNQNKSYFNFFSDGGNADAIKIPDGGYRNGISMESFEIVTDELGNKKHNLHLEMNGPKVFDFTLREISKSITELLDEVDIQKENIDYYLLHQSNHFIIKQIGQQLKVEQGKMLANIEHFGNTSGVSIPLLICSNKNILNNSRNVLMSGYGSGLNWGNLLINISKTKIFDIIEI